MRGFERILRNLGIDCDTIAPMSWQGIVPGKLGGILYLLLPHSPRQSISKVLVAPNYTLVGRLSTPQMYMFIRMMKWRHSGLIFDLDDALFLPTSSFLGFRIRPGSVFLEKTLKSADFVTVNGHFLLDYVRKFNPNSEIVHDPVDTDLFHPVAKRKGSRVTIGWEGDPRMHYGNLRIILDPLVRLSKEFDLKFKIISSLGFEPIRQLFRRLELSMEVDYGFRKWVPLHDLATALSDIDIMVAPLADTALYYAKSAFRAGVAMSMGAAIVASPVGEQQYVIRHGVNGFLAKKEDSWHGLLKLLIDDHRVLRDIGREGRKTAESELSYQATGQRLFHILNEVGRKAPTA